MENYIPENCLIPCEINSLDDVIKQNTQTTIVLSRYKSVKQYIKHSDSIGGDFAQEWQRRFNKTKNEVIAFKNHNNINENNKLKILKAL